MTLQNVYDTKNILVDQSVLSTEVIKEPVNKKVVEGTKKATSSTKYITLSLIHIFCALALGAAVLKTSSFAK